MPEERARRRDQSARTGPVQRTAHSRATHDGPVDVLLGHALFMALDPKQIVKLRPYPPLATLYAAAVLRDRGYRVAVFDAMLAPGEEAFRAALGAHRPRLVALYEDNFNFLSKMCLGRMRDAALAMLADARALGTPVVVAGSDATDEPETYLAAGAEAVILGEGDHTLAEVAAVLLGPPGTRRSGASGRSNGRRSPADALATVPGLALPLAAGGVQRTPPRPPERQPDVFPWPARELVDLDAYRRVWVEQHGYFSLNMASTRGCPFHCNWCAKPIWGQRYAMRTAEAVAAEMAELKHTVAPDRLWFADDIFGLRPDWTAEFGRAVERLGAQIPFQIQSRVDLLSEAAVDGLARAGCVEVWMGVESGSQRILDAMEKGIKVEQVPLAVERLRRRGIRACFFLQFGYPGETWEDILATVQVVRDVLPDDIGISVSYPLPGTRFYDMVAAQLGAKRHWTDSHDLAMMFQGTFTSEFYRTLHDLLHRELDARRALALAAPGTHDNGQGPPDAAQLQLATILAEWEHLAEQARSARSTNPTLIAPPATARPAPDLSRAAN